MKRNLLLFFLLGFGICSAQQWKNFTNSVAVNCIAADHDTIWIGSDGGLAKYLLDGTKLATYTHADGLADNQVTSIAIDSVGNKWFGTGHYTGTTINGGGISKFDGNTWTTYNTFNSGLASNTVNAVAIDSEGITWIATEAGLCRFDGNNWITYNTSNSGLPSNNVENLYIDRQDNKWLISQGPLTKFDGVNWTAVPYMVPGPIGSMAFDSQNNIWFGTYWNGPNTYATVAKYDGTNWKIYGYANTGMNFYHGSIAFDSSGQLWSDIQGGVCKFDGANWTSYTGGPIMC